MTDERRRTDEPLGEPFVPKGVHFVIQDGADFYGPFNSRFIAAQWAEDAKVRGRLIVLQAPMKTVPV